MKLLQLLLVHRVLGLRLKELEAHAWIECTYPLYIAMQLADIRWERSG